MRWFVGAGVLFGVLLMGACGSDDSSRDSPVDDAGRVDDAGQVDGGELDAGELDAGRELDSSAADSSTKLDASYFVNDAGMTVQECAKSAECPTGYRCEQDGARKSCVEVTGFGKSCAGDRSCEGGDANECQHLNAEAPGICTVISCAQNPGVCPSGWLCCGTIDPGYSACFVSCDNPMLHPIEEI